jgi:hypothetical protein
VCVYVCARWVIEWLYTAETGERVLLKANEFDRITPHVAGQGESGGEGGFRPVPAGTAHVMDPIPRGSTAP